MSKSAFQERTVRKRYITRKIIFATQVFYKLIFIYFILSSE